MMSRFRARATIAALALSLAGRFGVAAEETKPLPEPRSFLEEVRKNLRSDSLVLDQYTFTEKFTERHLDGKGGVKKTKLETYEVYPSAEPGKMYRRLISRDGKPIPDKELAEQDRKQEARLERKQRRLADEDEAGRQKRLAKEENARRQEQRVIEELFRMDDIAVTGRESIGGRSAVVVTFSPRPGFRPATEGGKVIQKLVGRAWIDEEEKQLVRLEASLLDSLAVGPGRIARLQKGATAYFQRRKVNDEVWLPAEARFTGAARLLLVFAARVDVFSQYSDYKKFSVGTETTITTDKASAD